MSFMLLMHPSQRMLKEYFNPIHHESQFFVEIEKCLLIQTPAALDPATGCQQPVQAAAGLLVTPAWPLTDPFYVPANYHPPQTLVLTQVRSPFSTLQLELKVFHYQLPSTRVGF
jgi:hypothetical protein